MPPSIVIFFSCLLTMLAAPLLTAQSAPKRLKLKHLTVQDGLSQSHVIAIFQDSYGYMWFGTYNGLNRYDGYQFEIFYHKQDNPYSLSDDWITSIAEDPEGFIWVGTFANGVNKFDRTTEKFTRYQFESQNPNSIRGNHINQVTIDSAGDVWICSSKGLSKYRSETDSFVNYQYRRRDLDYHRANMAYSMVEVTQGVFWIGTLADDLLIFNKDTESFSRLKYKTTEQSAAENQSKIVFKDKEGLIWVGATGHGLYKINPTTNAAKFVESPRIGGDLSHQNIRSIMQDRNGMLWIGTDGDGLCILDKHTDTSANYQYDSGNPDGLSSPNGIYAILEDNTGMIWMGLFNGGVNIYDSQMARFTSYRHYPSDSTSISPNAVLSLYQDSKRRVWVGTDGGGLNLFNPEEETFTHYRHDPLQPKSLCSNVITSIGEDAAGNLLLGTWGAGLMLWNPDHNELRQFRHSQRDSNSISGNDVWAIQPDSHGSIWLGFIESGLDRFDPASGSFTHFGPWAGQRNIIEHWDVRTLFLDSESRLWIGTQKAGVHVYSLKSCQISVLRHNPEDPNSLPKNDVRTIYQSKNGLIWLGTEGEGLSSYDSRTNRLTHYTVEDGLPSDVIHGILEDEWGNLWVSTTNGLSCFNPVNETFRNFDSRDGLPGNEFTYNASLRTEDGSLYFGGINGLTMFHPDNIKTNTVKPKVVLTNLKLLNRSVGIGEPDSPLKKDIGLTDTISLEPHHSVITLEFAALSYRAPGKNQYAYKLEGFDNDWIYSGNKRTVTYTNLDPGEYLFRVKASNNDGVWNDRGLSLLVIMSPYIWQTLWFRLTLGVVLLALGIASHHLWVRSVQRENRNLARIIQDRDVRNGKQQIAFMPFEPNGHSVQKKMKRILVPSRGELVFVAAKDIIYIESQDHYSCIRTPDESYLVNQSIAKLEESLDPDYFFRTHRSYIINISHIARIESWVNGGYKIFLLDGKELPLSRRRARIFKMFFGVE